MFPEDFVQVLLQIIRCFVKIVRVCFRVVCPMVVILLDDLDQEEEFSNF